MCIQKYDIWSKCPWTPYPLHVWTMKQIIAVQVKIQTHCWSLWKNNLILVSNFKASSLQQVVISRYNDRFLVRGDTNHAVLQTITQESLRPLRIKVFCHDLEFSSWFWETQQSCTLYSETSGQETSGIHGLICLLHFCHLLSFIMWLKKKKKNILHAVPAPATVKSNLTAQPRLWSTHLMDARKKKRMTAQTFQFTVCFLSQQIWWEFQKPWLQK